VTQNTKIVDRLLRVIAFVHAPMGAILGLPLIMLGVLMAPTFVSIVGSVLAVMIVVTIVVWVMICCVKPDAIALRLLRGRRVRFVVVRIPIYFFALAGVAWWASYSYIRLKG
jgi:hypothetical protein